jgi:hypothetical protein
MAAHYLLAFPCVDAHGGLAGTPFSLSHLAKRGISQGEETLRVNRRQTLYAQIPGFFGDIMTDIAPFRLPGRRTPRQRWLVKTQHLGYNCETVKTPKHFEVRWKCSTSECE